ncbi:MAG: NAD(P)/FAD-dependent oxidoreductase [Pseudomonadota bacterium]
MTAIEGLEALTQQVAHDLACLNHSADDWLKPQTHEGQHVYDAVIVGGGQSGMGAAFALQRERISNLLILDENPAGYEGPWETYARMATLRTPKHLTSIDLGVPSLTFRAWWEAQHGDEGWEKLDKIPRKVWMAYLRWYREALDLPIQNDTAVNQVEPVKRGLFRLHLSQGAPVLARKVVLATGIQGGGQWHTPGFIADNLPKSVYAHTSEEIDYAAMAGKRIAVLGAGASAFDNANHAFEQGVSDVHVFVRRKALPTVNPIRFMEQNGVIPRYLTMTDAEKYAFMVSFFDRNQPPTNDMFQRASANIGFELHLGCGWDAVEMDGEQVKVTTAKGIYHYDFLVLSTGLITDPNLRPELADLADSIARWADVYEPPADIANEVISQHPYMSDSFEFTPRKDAEADDLYGLYGFNYSAFINHSLSAAALSGLKYALPRLAGGIANQLFADDKAAILDAYYAYDEPEFVSEWHETPSEAAE